MNSENSNAAIVGYGVAIERYGAGFDPNSEFTAASSTSSTRTTSPGNPNPQSRCRRRRHHRRLLSMPQHGGAHVGMPLLSMHATYEMSSKVDLWSFYRFMLAFLFDGVILGFSDAEIRTNHTSQQICHPEAQPKDLRFA